MEFNFSKISLAVSAFGLLLIFLCEFFLVKELIKPIIKDHSGDYLLVINVLRIVTILFLCLNILLAFLAKRYEHKYNRLALISALLVFTLFWLPWAEFYFNNLTTYDINFKHL